MMSIDVKPAASRGLCNEAKVHPCLPDLSDGVRGNLECELHSLLFITLRLVKAPFVDMMLNV